MKTEKPLSALLKEAKKAIWDCFLQSDSEGADAFSRRVGDSAYYYKMKFREIEKLSFKNLPGGDMPRLFSMAWAHFKRNGFYFEKGQAAQVFEGAKLSLTEIDMAKSIIIAVALVESGAACRAQVRSVKRISDALELMKRCDRSDFSGLYSSLSAAERCFEENEQFYTSMTEATKAMYRKALLRYARRRGMDEAAACREAAEEAKIKGVPLGRVLGVDERKNAVPYLSLTALVFSVLASLAYVFCPVWALILLLLPLGALAFSAADFFFSINTSALPCPALAADSLPDGVRTLTVITSLIDGKSTEIFDRIERFFITNKAKGMIFGILADLPAADEESSAKDGELIISARKKTEELNRKHGEHFCLFIRKRERNAEGKYCGRERKRGAIEDLVRHLCGENTEFALVCGVSAVGVSYLISLDSDTRLPAAAAATLTGAMLHPLNKPVLKKGRVAFGYGIIQPAMQTCLKSSKESRFALRLSGAGGIDVYESAAFNRQQSVFGEGVFCGKGILDVALYKRVLDGVLPENRVLSHDMPEGNIMRCRYVSEVHFHDDVPSAVAAYFRRMHRWIRGDVQNLFLLRGYSQGLRGGLRIILNVARHLCPLLSFASVVISAFTGNLWVALFSLLGLLSPIFFTLIATPKALKFRARRFFSSVESSLHNSIGVAFFGVCALAQQALMTIDAMAKALWRSIRGKKLLYWVTAAQTELLHDGLFGCVVFFAPSALCGLLCFVFSSTWVGRLLGLAWFLFPLYAYYLSAPPLPENGISLRQKDKLKKRALPIWEFFKDNVNADTFYLPPDNVQYAPTEARALRTSPTNIGLYLLSVVAARDFGFIDAEEENRRLCRAFDSIEQLDKWKGHLYNWYSLEGLGILGAPYVSTVDSGNFCVCALALGRYLLFSGRTELAKRAMAFYKDADFAALYDKERKLFSLGYDAQRGKLSEICYDLYMSEARSGSYFAISMGQVPVSHWAALGRPTVSAAGHIGMASWSGTAFEYFMPQLFLPLYKDSFAYESLCFALSEQRRHGIGRLWGCSESAYYCFDADLNYQYKAHGTQSLALARYRDEDKVLSPYSVYLALCLAPTAAVNCLERYDEAGLGGKYGLYEAVDCGVTAGKQTVVESYMAHHMGMSLIAIANACFDNIFVKRFMSHPKTGAFFELLQEKVPTDATIYEAEKEIVPKRKPRVGEGFVKRQEDYKAEAPLMQLISHRGRCIAASNDGRVAFKFGKLAVNKLRFDVDFGRHSPAVFFLNGGRAFSAAPRDDGRKYSFESAESYAAHICASADFSGRVKYYLDRNGCFIVESGAELSKSYELLFAFDIQLATDAEYFAHPAFSGLSVEAEFDREQGVIVYCKRKRNGKEAVYLAVGFDRRDLRFEFETSKEGFDAYSLYDDASLIKKSYSCSVGACISPFCLIKTERQKGGTARLIISVAKSRGECLERFFAARFGDKTPSGSALFGERENALVCSLFYGRKQFSHKAACVRRELWRLGISGDYPLTAVLVREFSEAEISYYLRVFKRLSEMNVRTELLFLLCEEDAYSAEMAQNIRRLLRRLRCEEFFARRGGIFFGDGNDSFFVALIRDNADYFAESYEGCAELSAPFCGGALPKVRRVFDVVPYNFDGGYTIDKGKSFKCPMSYPLVGRGFGTVVTHGSLGFSFYRNAALCRIGAFEGDRHGGDDRGEMLYGFGDDICDLIACAAAVNYKDGVASYVGKGYIVEVFVCEKLPLKLVSVEFEEEKEAGLCLLPLLGNGSLSGKHFAAEELSFGGGTALAFHNNYSENGVWGFVGCLGEGRLFKSRAEFMCGNSGGAEDSVAVRCAGRSACFFVGAAPSLAAASAVLKLFAASSIEEEKKKANGFAASFLPKIRLDSDKTESDMLCRFAPYQVAASRFFSRAGFYQSGGAYGFRDQLQDSLWLIYCMPEQTQRHIIRAAARQYTDGSVQHWWHPKFNGEAMGIKSRCSDDFLWLPLCACEYFEKTGRGDIFSLEIDYLSSPPLGDAAERYELAAAAHRKESLYLHCVRALEYGKRYGAHGLVLMGSCDWNDAFSALGEGAETVFGTFFYIYVLRRFAKVASAFGDKEYAKRCEDEAQKLLDKAEDCFYVDRYARAYDGYGKALGVEGRDSCEIDALVQAAAVFAGANKQRCAVAMRTAFDLLYDRKHKLLRLFAPAFGLDTEYAGYINSYIGGLRENGGQYTHAVLWFAAACIECGMVDEGLELLQAVNPLWRCCDKELCEEYKTEPYAIVGDIYYAEGHKGRGGWSFYTGAAAWYCRTVLERVLGLRFADGFTRLWVTPVKEYELDVEFFGKLHISASAKHEFLLFDGKKASLPLILDGGEHNIQVPVR